MDYVMSIQGLGDVWNRCRKSIMISRESMNRLFYVGKKGKEKMPVFGFWNVRVVIEKCME